MSQAEAAEAGLAGRPIIAEGVPPVSDAELEAEAEELAAARRNRPPAEPYRRPRAVAIGDCAISGRRGGYGGGGRRASAPDATVRRRPRLLPPPDRISRALGGAAPQPGRAVPSHFLGTGTFGGPWSSRAD